MRRCLALALALGLYSSSAWAVKSEELSLTSVRQLLTQEPLFPGGFAFFSAASGLVHWKDSFFVVADDAKVLGRFSGPGPGTHQPVLNRSAQSADMEVRKKTKPDLECLTLLPTDKGKALLTLGSGSGEYRHTGALLQKGWFGDLDTTEFDLRPLYQYLKTRLPQLNIEGVAVVGDRLRLLHRGSGKTSPNAIIDLELATFLEAARAGRALDKSVVLTIQEVDLGSVEGPTRRVPWTFTDLCPLGQGRCLFTAAAEDTDDPYSDGEILGSAIGVMEADGSVHSVQKVAQCVKLEGIAVAGDAVFVVTDPDEPGKAAELYRVDSIRASQL